MGAVREVETCRMMDKSERWGMGGRAEGRRFTGERCVLLLTLFQPWKNVHFHCKMAKVQKSQEVLNSEN